MSVQPDVWRNRGSNDAHPILHASAVALDGSGCLIVGPSGSGKSSLALELMAFGCDLIGDDAVEVCRARDTLYLSPGPNISGQIEARGVALLKAKYVTNVACAFAVDLSQASEARLPSQSFIPFLGVELPYVKGASQNNLAPILFQMLKTKEWINAGE